MGRGWSSVCPKPRKFQKKISHPTHLDPGTELFANETDDTKIYAKLEEKYYLLYEQVIEEDADS